MSGVSSPFTQSSGCDAAKWYVPSLSSLRSGDGVVEDLFYFALSLIGRTGDGAVEQLVWKDGVVELSIRLHLTFDQADRLW